MIANRVQATRAIKMGLLRSRFQQSGRLGVLYIRCQAFTEGPIFPLVRREVYLHVLWPQTGLNREQFRYSPIEPLLGGGVPPVTG